MSKTQLDDITNLIAATMADFYFKKLNSADKTAADFQAEAAVVFSDALGDLYKQYSQLMGTMSNFVSSLLRVSTHLSQGGSQ